MDSPPSILNQNPPVAPALPNSRWHVCRENRRSIVFVHGIFSNSDDCWRYSQSGYADVFWPKLVSEDLVFKAYSVYLGGFPTSRDSKDAAVGECADELWNNLRDSSGTNPVPLDSDELIFVCHSTGGIIVRHLLEREWAVFATKRVGLALVASPSQGSFYASVLSLIALLFGNELAQALKMSNPVLRDIDRRFRRVLARKLIPGLFGREAYENISPWKIFGWSVPGRIVPRSSAVCYFADASLLAGTNHYTTVKPHHNDHVSHKFLRLFVQDFANFIPISPVPDGSPRTGGLAEGTEPGNSKLYGVEHRPNRKRSVGEIFWTVRIDNEGDAINQHAFNGAVLLAGEPRNVFALPNSVVESGYMSRFTLVHKESGSGIKLQQREISNSIIGVEVEFKHRPTEEAPASLAIQN